jgi:hypothetical protein
MSSDPKIQNLSQISSEPEFILDRVKYLATGGKQALINARKEELMSFLQKNDNTPFTMLQYDHQKYIDAGVNKIIANTVDKHFNILQKDTPQREKIIQQLTQQVVDFEQNNKNSLDLDSSMAFIYNAELKVLDSISKGDKSPQNISQDAAKVLDQFFAQGSNFEIPDKYQIDTLIEKIQKKQNSGQISADKAAEQIKNIDKDKLQQQRIEAGMKQCQALREQPLKKGDYFTPDINHSDKIAKKMEVVEKKVDAIIDKALNKHVNDCIELIMQENDIDEKNEPEVSALLDRFKNEINIAKALDTLSRDDLSNQSTKAHNRQQLLKKIKRLDHAVSKFIDNASAKVSNAQKEVATQVHSICQRLSQRLSQGLKSTQQSMTTMYNQAKASTKKESTQTQLDKEWQKDFADRFANSANFKQPTEDKGPTRPKNN